MKEKSETVVAVIGARSIGQAIARPVGAGKHILLADPRAENSEAAVGRAGTPDEEGNLGALLMGRVISGSDTLMGGGVTAAYGFGDLAPKYRKISTLY